MKHITSLQKEAQSIRLTQSEKAALRARVFAHLKRSGAVQPSPYFSFSHFQFTYVRSAMAALLIIVLMGASTVSAAAGALPGDVLYPVKINVNEAVQGALAVSSEAKAAFHTQVAGLRLEEAEELLSRGALTAHAEDTIEQNFDQHATQAKELSQKLQESDPGAAAEVEAQLASSLSAHGAILDQLKDESDDDAVKKESGDLALFVRSHQGKGTPVFAAATLAAPATMTLKATTSEASTTAATMAAEGTEASSSQERGVALHLQEKAQEELVEAQKEFAAVQLKLSSTTIENIKGELSALDTTMQEGSQALEAGDNSGAVQNFTDVLRVAVKLQVFFEAQQKFKKDFLQPLFKERQQVDGDRSGESGSGHDGQNDTEQEQDTKEGEGQGSSMLPQVELNL